MKGPFSCRFAWLLLATSLSCGFIGADSLPVGFIDEGVGSGTEEATVGRFVPNPRKNGDPMLLVVTKDGSFFAFEDPDNSDKRILIGNIADIICTNGPRGILNMEPHPNFTENRAIFVWYTRFAQGCLEDAVLGPSNRLSRFVLDEETLQLKINSEEVLLETPPSDYAVHDGGAMTIGKSDRMIYLAIGDGGTLKRGQQMDTLRGKMVRLELDGDVPTNNPYTTASGEKGVDCRSNKGRPPANATAGSICEEIFATGFRNPYRMGNDVNTIDKVLFAVGDVGNAKWEELSYGGTDYIGKNYGWDDKEGPCEKNSITNCPLPRANETDPFYYYQYSKDGAAVTGAVFVPENTWPEKYKFMFVEYVEDISFGPFNGTKALYYISRRTTGQNIRRIRYVGGTNRPPQAVILVANRPFKVNESIDFVGSTSFDPEGDKLTYFWTFGDGRTSIKANKTISFRRIGTYQISLTVRDTIGFISEVSATISVGTPPNVAMPMPKSDFRVGEVLRLDARANSSGEILTGAQFLWEVQLVHGGHYHPFESPRTGNNFTIAPAPHPEDFMAATNSFLRIILTATDSNGLSTTLRRSVFPKKVLIDIDSNPRGLNILVSDFNVVTPTTIVAWENQNLTIDAADQGKFTFKSWNIGGARERTYLVPPASTTNPKIIATFSGS